MDFIRPRSWGVPSWLVFQGAFQISSIFCRHHCFQAISLSGEEFSSTDIRQPGLHSWEKVKLIPLDRVRVLLGGCAQEIKLQLKDIDSLLGLILMMAIMEMLIVNIANIHCIFTVFQCHHFMHFTWIIHQMRRISLEDGYYHYLHFTDDVVEYTEKQGFLMPLCHTNPSVILIVALVNGASWSCAGHKVCSHSAVT